MAVSAAGDTVFQLGASFGIFVYVEGFGSIALQSTLDPAYSSWDLTDSFNPAISRGGRLACTGFDTNTGESGVVLLTTGLVRGPGRGSSRRPRHARC